MSWLGSGVCPGPTRRGKGRGTRNPSTSTASSTSLLSPVLVGSARGTLLLLLWVYNYVYVCMFLFACLLFLSFVFFTFWSQWCFVSASHVENSCKLFSYNGIIDNLIGYATVTKFHGLQTFADRISVGYQSVGLAIAYVTVDRTPLGHDISVCVRVGYCGCNNSTIVDMSNESVYCWVDHCRCDGGHSTTIDITVLP